MIPQSLLVIEEKNRDRVHERSKETRDEKGRKNVVPSAEHLNRVGTDDADNENDRSGDCEGNHGAHFRTPVCLDC